jgi:peptidase E
MTLKKGKIVLMGSGELTATMVEVHKELLASLKVSKQAVFLDTPAGFQLNVDYLSQKASDYFKSHIQRPLLIASFKSNDAETPYSAQQTFRSLKESGYILIGPGSPSYAVRQWLQTPIPDILKKNIENGGCLVAASAAALTVGRFTLPVYEIYKAGDALHWLDGMDILGHFGFNIVVVPHWNNAEGGTHDTRFCYMGEPRFKQLEAMLPDDVIILGLDEHTACIIDLDKEEFIVKGLGSLTLRTPQGEFTFEKGRILSLDILHGKSFDIGKKQNDKVQRKLEDEGHDEQYNFWDNIRKIDSCFQDGLKKNNPDKSIRSLLNLDKTIWEAHQELENPEFISQSREIYREMIVLIGSKLASSLLVETECLAPLVDEIINLRNMFRQQKKWVEADALRVCLERVNIVIEDTKDGTLWKTIKRGGDLEHKES